MEKYFIDTIFNKNKKKFFLFIYLISFLVNYKKRIKIKIKNNNK